MSKSKSNTATQTKSETVQELAYIKQQVVDFFEDEKIKKFTAQGACYQSNSSILSCTKYMADLKHQISELYENSDTNNIRIPRLVELYQEAEHQLELHEMRHQADCIVYENTTGEAFKLNNTKTSKVNQEAVDRILGK